MKDLVTLLLVLFAPIILILAICWLFLYGLWIEFVGWLMFRKPGQAAVQLGESFAADLQALDPCLLGEQAGSYGTVADRILTRVLEQSKRSGLQLERIARDELAKTKPACSVSPLRLRRVVANLHHRVKQGQLV